MKSKALARRPKQEVTVPDANPFSQDEMQRLMEIIGDANWEYIEEQARYRSGCLAAIEVADSKITMLTHELERTEEHQARAILRKRRRLLAQHMADSKTKSTGILEAAMAQIRPDEPLYSKLMQFHLTVAGVAKMLPEGGQS